MRLNNKQGGSFEPCPEYTGRAVCVDVTPPEERDTTYGRKVFFRLVFEVEAKREDGKRFAVWSTNFTPSLNPKANLRKFLRQWLGRDINKQEEESFTNTDDGFEKFCLGRPGYIVVTHSEGNNGETYANITALTPHKEQHGQPLAPSFDFVRKVDRDKGGDGQGSGSGASYRGAEKVRDQETGEEAGREDWMLTEVHVGKHVGVQLGDLDAEAVDKLLKNWVPVFEGMEKPKAADKRLYAALKKAEEALAQPAGDF